MRREIGHICEVDPDIYLRPSGDFICSAGVDSDNTDSDGCGGSYCTSATSQMDVFL